VKGEYGSIDFHKEELLEITRKDLLQKMREVSMRCWAALLNTNEKRLVADAASAAASLVIGANFLAHDLTATALVAMPVFYFALIGARPGTRARLLARRCTGTVAVSCPRSEATLKF
jgi:hypothetical protein